LTDNGLDLTSRRILQILGTDGRSSYQSIADEVGLSRPAVMERVKRLEESGYIAGYAARLDRAKLGMPITAFVAVRYSSGTDAYEESGVKALERHPSVLECHHVAGEDCFVLKVAAPTIDSLEKLIRELKGQSHGVTTRTTIVLSTVFEKPGIIPVEND
jgi:Lrp/AsnC family leucine-responsive transcriptional regulator